MGKKERCQNGTRRNKKTGKCEKTDTHLTMSKYFGIVKILLETSKIYCANLDVSEEEVEEPPNELMRIHMSNAFQILVNRNDIKLKVWEQINQTANRAFLENWLNPVTFSKKKVDKVHDEIKRWFKEDVAEPLLISEDATIYYLAIKENIHMFRAIFFKLNTE